jgi:hypothetical protein
MASRRDQTGDTVASERCSIVAARSLLVLADYHQFYVWDAGMGRRAPEDYADDDVRRRVKVAPHVVVVLTARNTMVPVTVEVHTHDPGVAVGDWQHIAECTLELPTGGLQVHASTGAGALDLVVAPGTYRVRVLFAGLDTFSGDGLEGDDRYVVMLWPGAVQAPCIVRQWEEAG